MTSRSYEEYAAFFVFDAADWRGKRVLDCSAGASAFVAEAAVRGVDAYAVDPAYAMPGAELERVARDSHARGSAIADEHAAHFTWVWYGTREAREALRRRALATFLTDRDKCPGRYIAASLPQLPFDDNAFDLALCSHLLFTWADVLDESWHRAALRELVRVATEVRVFPTVLQGAGEPVPFLPTLVDELGGSMRSVDYEFQVGANEMLVVTPSRSP